LKSHQALGSFEPFGSEIGWSDGPSRKAVSITIGYLYSVQDWGLALSRTVVWAVEQLALEGSAA